MVMMLLAMFLVALRNMRCGLPKSVKITVAVLRKRKRVMAHRVPSGHSGVSGQAVQHNVVLAREQELDLASLQMEWKAGIVQVNLLRQHFVRGHRAVDGRIGVRGPCAIENAEQVTVSAQEHELPIRYATVKELTENTRSAIHNLARCNAPGRSGAHGVSAPLGVNAKLAYKADRGNVLVSLAVTA
ncbi:hypothetical protein ANCDUO_04038 [Ancylostoma duodenale]|uniref:Secreted protein n=1 Tax=Ancylostoma duodenale TaxID=51022 RepID=A0A0C2H830_9BILA|nr:hypothetical protein ANCDUO_04038 [Ancylostoma duodenale]